MKTNTNTEIIILKNVDNEKLLSLLTAHGIIFKKGAQGDLVTTAKSIDFDTFVQVGSRILNNPTSII